jgi:hypothetical protein
MEGGTDSPFSGLDKALLRSTKETSATPVIAHDSTPSDTADPKEVSKLVSKEVSKFTSKLISEPPDPAVNKVGYYFTRREMDRLDTVALAIKQTMRERYDIKVTKNDVVRACISVGMDDWDANGVAAKLVNFFTSKETS